MKCRICGETLGVPQSPFPDPIPEIEIPIERQRSSSVDNSLIETVLDVCACSREHAIKALKASNLDEERAVLW